MCLNNSKHFNIIASQYYLKVKKKIHKFRFKYCNLIGGKYCFFFFTVFILIFKFKQFIMIFIINGRHYSSVYIYLYSTGNSRSGKAEIYSSSVPEGEKHITAPITIVFHLFVMVLTAE